MHIFLYFLTMISPIIAMPFSFILILVDPKNRKHYMIQNSISLAFFAYCWEPTPGFDLYTWHIICSQLRTMRFQSFIEYIKTTGEPINTIIKYIVAQTGNYSLLQFSIILVGYLLLNNLLFKMYTKIGKESKSVFFVYYILMMATMLYVHFASGLFYTLSALIFANGD